MQTGFLSFKKAALTVGLILGISTISNAQSTMKFLHQTMSVNEGESVAIEIEQDMHGNEHHILRYCTEDITAEKEKDYRKRCGYLSFFGNSHGSNKPINTNLSFSTINDVEVEEVETFLIRITGTSDNLEWIGPETMTIEIVSDDLPGSEKDCTYIPGDTDYDMDVDFTDALRVFGHFGSTHSGQSAGGDFNGDMRVDFYDICILSYNFGRVGDKSCHGSEIDVFLVTDPEQKNPI